MNHDLSQRGSAALGLSIAKLMLDGASVSDEDQTLSKQGVELSWKWVEAQEVDPFKICEYIDGEINLPFRSTLYDPDSTASQAMAAVFLAVGLVALSACKEGNKAPSESVENYGENEWKALLDISRALPKEKQEIVQEMRSRLLVLTEKDKGKFGAPLKKSDVDVAL